MAPEPTAWKNRIVGYGEEPPDQLLAHPGNWRLHPAAQQDALSGVLAEVGVVQNVLVNKRSGRLVDGHLRATLAMRQGQATVPVTYVDLDDAEEALILATLDPISALATADAAQLDALLREVSTGDAAVQQMLADLAERNGVVPHEDSGDLDPFDHWSGMPEFDNENLKPAKQLIVNFRAEQDVEAFARLIEQNVTMATKSVWYPVVPRNRLADLAYGSVAGASDAP